MDRAMPGVLSVNIQAVALRPMSASSKACQLQDWQTNHKLECSRLLAMTQQATHPAALSDALLVARVLRKEAAQHHSSDAPLRSESLLPSDLVWFDEDRSEMQSLASWLTTHHAKLFPEVEEMLCRFRSNNFTITDELLLDVGADQDAESSNSDHKVLVQQAAAWCEAAAVATSPESAIELYRRSLNAREKCLSNPWNVLILEVHSQMLTLHIEMGNGHDAVQTARAIYAFYKRLYHPNHPLTGLHLYTLGDLESQCHDDGGAVQHLNEALRILTITHGANHAMVQTLKARMNEFRPSVPPLPRRSQQRSSSLPTMLPQSMEFEPEPEYIESCAWSQVDVHGTLPPRRSGALGVVHENHMYIFGGYDGRDGNYFNDLFYFNFGTAEVFPLHDGLASQTCPLTLLGSLLDTRRWSEMPSSSSVVRPESRTDHIMVLHDANIYIFGGYNGSSRFNNMYRYEIPAKSWRKVDAIGSLPSGRFGHTGAVHESSHRLIVFGGWDGRDTLDDLHQYEFATNTWSPMVTSGRAPPHRYRHTAVIFDTSMFVFGGVDKAHSRFNDLQRLDMTTNTWTEVHTTGFVPSSRTFHRAVVVLNRMYLLGGYDGTDRLHDLYSIHVGPLSPPSLLALCASYARRNVDDILAYTSFKGVPQCPPPLHQGRAAMAHANSAMTNHHMTLQTQGDKPGRAACVCGHGTAHHERIDERKLIGEPYNARMMVGGAMGGPGGATSSTSKGKVYLLYSLYKRIFDGGPADDSPDHEIADA
ncbi:hypothetical protein DYB30_001651 [Aphanomyces astaci]|uniref:LisH domain-containing protein n=2 Tax=Aphanomyces astaci TaxID=112090 RepID=A0A397C518_APHAT|nr:hypothetical protein DYB30_001651 [Aphanomyces astaci]